MVRRIECWIELNFELGWQPLHHHDLRIRPFTQVLGLYVLINMRWSN